MFNTIYFAFAALEWHFLKIFLTSCYVFPRLEHDLQQRDKTIETLQSRLAARPLVHSRSTSPFTPQSISTPTRLDHTVVAGQGTGLISPPPVGRWTTPADFSPRKEKVRKKVVREMCVLFSCTLFPSGSDCTKSLILSSG